MTRPLALLLGLAALMPAAAGAQQTHTPPPGTRHLSVEDALFPAELVMQHQRELGLTAQQRTSITEAIKALQAGVVDHQWQLQDEQQKLHELLVGPAVAEAAVLAQVDRVLELERNVKRLHMVMLVRIKNTLTPEQQEKLKELHGHGLPTTHDEM
jgi:Spy/CpxP family protein refolding chaperone